MAFDPFSLAMGGITGITGMMSTSMNNQAQMERQQQAQMYNSAQAMQAQQFNESQAAINRNFQADSASMNRDYQTMMSNTAYQRAAADMKAAGINPMVAYQQGGASSPAGGQAAGSQAQGVSASSPAPMAPQNAIMSGLSSAFEGMKASPVIDKVKADAATAAETTKNVEQDTANKRQAETLINRQAATEAARKEQVRADTDKAIEDTRRTRQGVGGQMLGTEAFGGLTNISRIIGQWFNEKSSGLNQSTAQGLHSSVGGE